MLTLWKEVVTFFAASLTYTLINSSCNSLLWSSMYSGTAAMQIPQNRTFSTFIFSQPSMVPSIYR